MHDWWFELPPALGGPAEIHWEGVGNIIVRLFPHQLNIKTMSLVTTCRSGREGGKGRF